MNRHLALALCGLLAGCGSGFTVRPLTEAEIGLLPDHSFATPEQVPIRAIAQLYRVRELEAPILASMETPRGAGTFDGALVLRSPGEMRMKAFRGAGATFLDLLLNDSGATLYLPGEQKAYQADPDQVIRMGEDAWVTPRQMVASLIVARRTPQVDPTVASSGDGWVLRYPGQAYLFDKRTLFLTRAILFNEDGSVALRAAYREYRLSDGEWLPRVIEIRDGEGRFSLDILIRNARVNKDPVPAAFDLKLPESVEVVRPK